MEYDWIKQNLEDINKRIAEAAEKSGRKLSDVILVGVTKTVDVPLIQAGLDFGIMDIGENRVQELLSKYDKLTANWHLIGHLQTNKVKHIVDKVKMIHSVDSVALAQEINKRAKSAGIVMDVLVEVNIAGEESKFGVYSDGTKEFIKILWDMEAIAVKGLMTVAPFVDEGEKNRDLFKKMRTLFVDINETREHNVPMQFLSMGMTGDFTEAVEEGANIVRIGTGIFGRRN